MSNLDFGSISLVVFDLDGTLVDAFGDIHAAVNYARNQMGMPLLDYTTVRSYVGNGVEVLMRRALGTDEDSIILEGVDLWKEYSGRHPADHAKLYPGAHVLLEHLRDSGIKTAVLSNKVHEVTLNVLRHLEVDLLFDAVVGDNGRFRLKPHPEALQAIIQLLDESPRRTLLVGDGEPDILAAKSAGAWSCGATWGLRSSAQLQATGADKIVHNFDELKEFFSKESALD